jgi:hypothetical protein
MKLTLRVTASWIAFLATSFLFFAMGYRAEGCMSPLPTLAESDPARMHGLWLVVVVGMLAAAELWRFRRLGLIAGAAFLLFLSVGSVWNLWQGVREPMALVPLSIDAALALGLMRPNAWRACPRAF